MSSNLILFSHPALNGVLIVLIVALVLYGWGILDSYLRDQRPGKPLSLRVRFHIWLVRQIDQLFGLTMKNKVKKSDYELSKLPSDIGRMRSGLTKKELKHYMLSRRRD